MYFTLERIKRILNELFIYTHSEKIKIESFKVKEGIRRGCENPYFDTSNWDNFNFGDRWGGRDKHFWFKTKFVIPDEFEGKTVVFEVKTGKEGDWDALNPQFFIYVNGKLIQGLDVNHREIIICENAVCKTEYDISLYAYSGMNEGFVYLEAYASIL